MLMLMLKRRVALASILLVCASGLAGCFYSTKETKETVRPIPNSTVVVTQPRERVYTYPDGRYELRGDGTASSPYYWVWIPAGVQVVPNPPPVPPLPPSHS
jgi:hypothetical protein